MQRIFNLATFKTPALFGSPIVLFFFFDFNSSMNVGCRQYPATLHYVEPSITLLSRSSSTFPSLFPTFSSTYFSVVPCHWDCLVILLLDSGLSVRDRSSSFSSTQQLALFDDIQLYSEVLWRSSCSSSWRYVVSKKSKVLPKPHGPMGWRDLRFL